MEGKITMNSNLKILYVEDEDNIKESVMKRANTILYRVKKNDRNRVEG